MDKKTIITISREYGSGGRIVGEKLARELGIPFYDNELIAIAAESSGFSAEYFKDSESAQVGNVLLSLSSLTSPTEVYGLPINEKIFLIQSKVIKELAKQGSFVIVGRCADYVLKDKKHCINIFIRGNIKDRVKRAVEEYGLDQKHAESSVIKTDKRRASYYSYFTNNKWGDALQYDLVLNTSKIGIDNTAKIVKEYVRLKQECSEQ